MTWRQYIPADTKDVRALLAKLEARVGQPIDVPKLDDEPVLISIVREHEGVVTHVVFAEAVAEIQSLGECPIPLEEWDGASMLLGGICRHYKLRMARAFVPHEALERKQPEKPTPIERILHRFGFVREDHSKMTCYSRWVGKEADHG
jgi:hypothetical protein